MTINLSFKDILMSIVMGSVLGYWIMDAAMHIQQAIAYVLGGYPGAWQPAAFLFIVVLCIGWFLTNDET